MKLYWDLARTKVDDMALRERAMIFIAACFVLVSLINTMLLDPLLAKQTALSSQVIQQQEKMKALQADIQSLLQAKRDDQSSPLRERIAQLEQQLQEQDSYLQNRSSRLVEPQKMAELLKQVLAKNSSLQLVELKTMPVSFLIEKTPSSLVGESSTPMTPSSDNSTPAAVEKQIYKHGVQISVRGNYLELLRYISMLESLHAQMYWGEVSLSVEKYPQSVLTLTLYTLSLDKKWLTV